MEENTRQSSWKVMLEITFVRGATSKCLESVCKHPEGRICGRKIRDELIDA
jgi:hypothetical protein